MTKFRKSILIFGIFALMIAAALSTFVVLSITGSLEADPIALEFTVEDAEKGYDGEPLIASSYSITGGFLIKGHTPVVTFTGSQTGVGESQSGLAVKIVNDDGFDVSKEYKIRVNGGRLSVGRRGLQIKIGTKDIIYAGKTVDIGNDYAVTLGSLVNGHRLSVSIKDEWLAGASNIVADKYLTGNDVDINISDGSGANATPNYYITISGKVNIVKRPLTITPISAQKIYDGTPLECTQYKIEAGSLAEGHYIIATFAAKDGSPAKVTDVNGNRPLETVVQAVICDIAGNEVTDNYDFKSGTGTLTVNKASLLVTAKSQSWLYDGKEHAFAATETSPEQAIGLVGGDIAEVTYGGSITDVGTAESTIIAVTIKDALSGRSKDGNYDVTIKKGTLEVKKAPLTVIVSNIEKDYDGAPFDKTTDQLYEIRATMSGLRLQFINETYAEDLFKDRVDIGTYPYTFSTKDFYVVDGKNVNLTDMFEVTVNAGNMKINRRESILTSNTTLTKEYDGNFIFDVNDELTLSGLVTGHRISKIACEPVPCGTNQNAKVRYLTIVNERGTDVTDYYNLTGLSDTAVPVIITPKPVKVYLEPCTLEFKVGGITRDDLASYVRCEGASASNFYVSNPNPFVVPGTQTVTFAWCGNADEEANYAVEYGNKNFELIKRRRSAGFAEKYDRKIYDGLPLDAGNKNIIGAGISTSERDAFTLKSSNMDKVTDAGVYKAEIIYESTTDILTVSGTYTIERVSVSVSLKNTQVFTKIYDGQPFIPNASDYEVSTTYNTITKKSTTIAVGGLVRAIDIIDACTERKQTFAGAELYLVATGERVKSSNIMDITFGNVFVTVEKRTLTITLAPIYGTPDGSENLTGIISVNNLAAGDSVDYGDGVGVVLASGNTTFLNKEAVKIKRDGNDVTNNYEFPENVMGAILPTN